MRKMWKASGSIGYYNSLMLHEEARQDTIAINQERLDATTDLGEALEAIGQIWEDEDDLRIIEEYLEREESSAEARGIFRDFWNEFYALPYFRAL